MNEQKKLTANGALKEKDKAKLKKIENDLKDKAEMLNNLVSQKNHGKSLQETLKNNAEKSNVSKDYIRIENNNSNVHENKYSSEELDRKLNSTLENLKDKFKNSEEFLSVKEDLNKLNHAEKEIVYDMTSQLDDLNKIKPENLKADDRTALKETEDKIKELENALEKFYEEMDHKYNQNPDMKIEHISSDRTKNLEDPKVPPYPAFEDNALIYGAGNIEDTYGRLLVAKNANISKDAPNIADVFLYNLNSKGENTHESGSLFNDITKQVAEEFYNTGKISDETLNKFLNNKEVTTLDKIAFHGDKVNTDSDKKLLEDLLRDPVFSETLKKLQELDEEIIKGKEKMLKKPSKEKQKELDKKVEQFGEYFGKLNERKTIVLLDKVMTSGGKIYFSLDGIASSKDKNGKVYLDKDKLNDILFNKNSAYYNKITSEELRYIYKKYLDNPNMKFMINKQIVEFPAELKNNKYSALDKENAFDFPRNSGEKVEINDTANEEKIVPEHYEPLGAPPPNQKGLVDENIVLSLDLQKKIEELVDKEVISYFPREEIEKLNPQEKAEALEMLKKYEELISKEQTVDVIDGQLQLQEKMEKFSEAMEEKYNVSDKDIVIEHLPKVSTGNLEDPYMQLYPEFKNNALVYGATANDEGKNREAMLDSIKPSGHGPLIADVYNYAVDIQTDLRGNPVLTPEVLDYVNAVAETDGNVPEQIINNLLSITNHDPYDKATLFSDKVNPTADRELITELLSREDYVDAVKEISYLNKKIKELSDDYNQNPSEDKKQVLEFHQDEMFNKFNEISTMKTLAILDKVLTSGGQIYFTLDGIATSKDGNGKIYMDKDKLEAILFDDESDYYDTITSSEFRYVYKYHLENPNLKFVINNQVIEFPEDLKGFDLDNIKNSDSDNDSDGYDNYNSEEESSA